MQHFSSPPWFICYCFNPKRTNSDPISTNSSIKNIFFRFRSIFFSIIRFQFFIIFHYFYSFSAPKSGVQSIPRGAAVLMVFFSSQTDQISPNFDHFFDERSTKIASWSVLKTFWSVLARLGASWDRLGSVLERLESSMGAPREPKEVKIEIRRTRIAHHSDRFPSPRTPLPIIQAASMQLPAPPALPVILWDFSASH